ncbi:MAG TPA: zf-HC2 domain-containing protein, partial [Gemmataceae bacterium]|nr:zf-HC2 domain-containing protein [Gemmataceae bacterium]
MLTCDQTADLLLDYLYDLLDEEAAGKLREHLAACPACQAALAAAEAQQHLLARAAQIYAEVPAFTAPSATPSAPVETIQPAPAAAPQAPATLPLPTSPQTKPRRLLRWLAAAAVLFVVAGGAFGFIQYQNGWTERRAELAQVRHEINAIERQQLPSVERTYRAQKAALPAQLKPNYLQIEVSGPANYERDASNRYQVATRDLESKPVAATVIAQLKLPGQEQPIFEQKLAISGDGIVTLPAGLNVPPDTLPYLQVKAQRETAVAEVPQLLPVAEPAYVSHLALSKSTYRVGDILFFRSLTVHRFSLQPATDEFEIACTLLGPNEQPLRTVHAVVHQGVAGGEIALTGDFPAGEYTLRIEDRGSRI